MKKLVLLVVGLSLLGIYGCSKNNNQGKINAGDVSVDVSNQGVKVNAPGVNISTDENGNTSVSAPGVNINTSADGQANVTMPGISINNSTSGTNVSIPGVNINTTTDTEETSNQE